MNLRATARKLLFFLAAVAVFAIARSITKPSQPPSVPPPDISADPAARMNWDQLMIASQQALKANDLDQAVQLCNRAMLKASSFAPTDTRYSYSKVLRAEIYLWQKQNDTAEQTFKDAVSSCEKAAGINSPALVYPLSSQANFYYFIAHQNEKVVALYARILQIVQHDPNHDIHDPSVWTRNLAKIYQEQGNFTAAESLFDNDIKQSQKIDDPWLAGELLEQASFYRAAAKYDQAQHSAQRALAIREKSAAALPPTGDIQDAQLEISRCLNNLGETYLASHKPDLAEIVYRRSLTISQKYIPPGQPDLAIRLTGLADALRAEGKFDSAEPLYKQSLELTEKTMAPDSPDIAAILEKYGSMLNAMHRPEEAQKLLTRAADIRKSIAAATK